jgi:5-formyltetrahydrofolate cyclo-ligase
MDKKNLRKLIKAQVAMLTPEQKEQEANEVFSYIEQSPEFLHSTNIMFFSSLPDEIPTHHFIERWSSIKNVYLPRVTGDDIELIKYEPGSLKKGSFNILEPTGDNIADPNILDIIIVPGVAYDRNGNRCGRGKGYYDRFLSHTVAATIAVCFDCQLVDNLPTEPHDIPVQHIVTNSFKTL